jgi:hypothetical protein
VNESIAGCDVARIEWEAAPQRGLVGAGADVDRHVRDDPGLRDVFETAVGARTAVSTGKPAWQSHRPRADLEKT